MVTLRHADKLEKDGKEKEVMEKYEELEIEVIEFDAEDIITTSSGGDDDGEWAYEQHDVEKA